jgi:hypothetical protein
MSLREYQGALHGCRLTCFGWCEGGQQAFSLQILLLTCSGGRLGVEGVHVAVTLPGGPADPHRFIQMQHAYTPFSFSTRCIVYSSAYSRSSRVVLKFKVSQSFCMK